MAELLIFHGEALVFDQIVVAENSVQHIFDILSFTEVTRPSIIRQSVSQVLTFNQQVNNDFSIINRTISQTLFFNQLAQRVVAIENIFQNLFLIEHVTNKTDHVQQSLIFLQTVTGFATKAAIDILTFNDVTTFTVERSFTVLDTLTFITQATAYKESPDFSAITLPTLTPASFVTLTKGTLSLTLRSPNFDNVERLEFVRIHRRTRGHDLIIFRDPIWPKSEVLSMTFSGLSQIQVWDLLSFMKATIGQDITFIDHEDQEWLGIITTPTSEVIQEGRDCKFTASFEFQGELV